VLGRLGEPVDRVDPEQREALEVLPRVPLGQRLHGRLGLLRRVDELVLDVGDVDDPRDLEPLEREVPLDRVEDDRADHVPDVGRLVDGRAAQVDADASGADGLEQLFLLGEGVVDAQAHYVAQFRHVDRGASASG
jgi:hypothetical protein